LHRRRHHRGCPHQWLPPLRFCSPSTSSRYRAATLPEGYQPPGTCPLGVSHALRAFLRPGPAGLVSCRSRPWGFHPSGSISTRRAVRPLGRRYPHEVGGSSWLRPNSLGCLGSWGARCCRGRLSRRRRVREPAPLQGIAPCEWPCLRGDCLGQPGDRDPRGFLLPRGFSLLVGDPPRVHPLTGL
jgi:hypothetical protein